MSKIIATTITIMLILTITTILILTISADASDNNRKERNSAVQENPLREKCYKCHEKSVEYKEWETSGHAKALVTLKKSPDAQGSCLECHSSGYIINAPIWGSGRFVRATLETAQNAVACSSCHRHGATGEHYLIKSPKKLCSSCHKMDCG
ncbi:MAG: cytochrome c3 family protein [Candidatus Poribacteria bacterium]